jgi:hypothetical protein
VDTLKKERTFMREKDQREKGDFEKRLMVEQQKYTQLIGEKIQLDQDSIYLKKKISFHEMHEQEKKKEDEMKLAEEQTVEGQIKSK